MLTLTVNRPLKLQSLLKVILETVVGEFRCLRLNNQSYVRIDKSIHSIRTSNHVTCEIVSGNFQV